MTDDARMWPELSPVALMVVFPYGSRMLITEHGFAETNGYIVALQGEEFADAIEGYHFDDQNLGDLPGGPGIWVWEGFAGWTPGPDPDFAFECGAWRRATPVELRALADGGEPLSRASERKQR